MRVRIYGRYWRVEWCESEDIGGDDGCCDHPAAKGKTLTFARDQTDRALLETVIHEALHAADWSKSHEWVHPVAADIAGLLWRLGYRRG